MFFGVSNSTILHIKVYFVRNAVSLQLLSVAVLASQRFRFAFRFHFSDPDLVAEISDVSF